MFPPRPDPLGPMTPILAASVLAADSCIEAMTAAVERRAAEFEADLRPQGAVAQFLTRRAAFLAVRLEQMQHYHAAMTAQRARLAESEDTRNRLAEAEQLYSWLAADPAVYVRRLFESPEGIDRLLDAWTGLRMELTDADFPRWAAEHRNMALQMMGFRPNDLPVSPVTVWSDAYNNNYSPIVEAHPQFAPLTRLQRRAVAGRKLLAAIDDEMEALGQIRAGIDRGALEADRSEAIDRAVFDPGPTGKLAARYEMAIERNFHRALQIIADLDATPRTDRVPAGQVAPDELAEAGPGPPTAGPSRPTLGQIGQRAADQPAAMLDPPTGPKTTPAPKGKARRRSTES